MVPSSWITTTIGETAELGSGSTPSRSKQSDYFDRGTIPWVKTGDLNNDLIQQTAESITQQALEESSCKIYPSGTLLVAMYGGFKQIGRTGLLGCDAAINQALTAITLDQKIACPKYVQQWLNGRVGHWKRLAGSSRKDPNITKSEVAAFPLLLPPANEQRAIVCILSTWDRGIRQLTDLIAAKVRFKHGLMQQLLTGKRRFPEFRPTRFSECQIGDVLHEILRPVVWDDDELYRLAGIRRHSGGLFWREALLGKHIKVKRIYTLQTGDFLISQRQAAYGAMGVVPAEFAGGKVSPEYAVLSPKTPDRIDMRYIGYLSAMTQMRHQAYLSCNGFFAERLRLNFDPSEFLKQRILLPQSREEQAKIADLLDSLVEELGGLKQQLDRLRQQKRGLMQKLLTGEVRVKLPKGVA